MKDQTAIRLFKIIPQNFISWSVGIVTRIPLPSFILYKIIFWFKKKFDVKDEYLEPKDGFTNFNSFFTRKLKDDSRVIDTTPSIVVSPVDARIDQYGKIDNASLIQAKGLMYSIDDLVPSESASKFLNGSFITLYLSPSDYHRIHSPFDGEISGYYYLPGALFTVQDYMVKGLPNLFVKNERVITYINSSIGTIGVCKVGALNVGRISLSYDSCITNKLFFRKKEKFYSEKIAVKKGDELGVFNLGSTVILLFEKDKIKFDNFTPGTKVKLGQRIASIKK